MQSEYQLYRPYIIYYLSKTYVHSYFQIELIKKKKLTGEQLIGIVCGTVSNFLIVLYIIIFIYRKMNYESLFSNDIYSSLSFSEESHFNSKEQNQENEKKIQ